MVLFVIVEVSPFFSVCGTGVLYLGWSPIHQFDQPTLFIRNTNSYVGFSVHVMVQFWLTSPGICNYYTQLMMIAIKQKSKSREATRSNLSASKHMDNLLVFGMFQMGSARVTHTFNLSNVGIPGTWLLLNSQSTIHRVSYPDLIDDIHTGPW